MNVQEMMQNGICIYERVLYYVDEKGVVSKVPVKDIPQIDMAGYKASDLLDGIIDKDVRRMTYDYGRDSRKYDNANLARLADIAIINIGKSVTCVHIGYYRWLDSTARAATNRSNSMCKSINAKKNQKQQQEKEREERVRKSFDGNIRIFQGITRTCKDSFEILFTMDPKLIQTHGSRYKWAKDHGHQLAEFGFKEICRDPRMKAKLKPNLRYYPGNVTVTPYGDIYIEFNGKPIPSGNSQEKGSPVTNSQKGEENRSNVK